MPKYSKQQFAEAPLLRLRAIVSFNSTAAQYTCVCIDTGTYVNDSEEGAAISGLLQQLEMELRKVVTSGQWPNVRLGDREAERAWILASAKLKPRAVRLQLDLSTEVVFTCCPCEHTPSRSVLEAA